MSPAGRRATASARAPDRLRRCRYRRRAAGAGRAAPRRRAAAPRPSARSRRPPRQCPARSSPSSCAGAVVIARVSPIVACSPLLYCRVADAKEQPMPPAVTRRTLLSASPPGAAIAARIGARSRQGLVRHQLGGRGRARRLLPGAGRRHLPQTRPRRHHRAGRAEREQPHPAGGRQDRFLPLVPTRCRASTRRRTASRRSRSRRCFKRTRRC